MATVGQQLTAPESGWKRYNTTDTCIKHKGKIYTTKDDNYYGGSTVGINGLGFFCFRFTGTRLRIITYKDCLADRSTDIDLYIDDVKKGNFSGYTSAEGQFFQVLALDISGLSSGEHHVKLANNQELKTMTFDALDIDETGELLPCIPEDVDEQALLRVTMLDSSEREYRLPTIEINGFINWYKQTTGIKSPCHELNNIIDGSKEYLAFEKIISFKVIPYPSIALWNVTTK